MKTIYEYQWYFLTTDQIPADPNYISSMEVTEEESILIDEWANLVSIDWVIEITPE